MPTSLKHGTVLNGSTNQYLLIRVLSSKGGYGMVYEGKVVASGHRVAIKQNWVERYPPGDPRYKDYEGAREQFRKEAQILKQLSHPNLVRYIDYLEDGQGEFLVMEFVEGNDLRELWEKKRQAFAEMQVLEWGITLCEVLHLLHSRQPPIIHRDIKPDNIRIEEKTGRVVLIDLGIAKEFKWGQKTVRWAQAYSEGFAPLEQYGAGTDQRTDLYGLGATLYFLLMQKAPEIPLERQAKGQPLDFSARQPPLCLLTVEALTKALEIQRERRFQSASEMKQALEDAWRQAQQQAQQGQLTRCIHCGFANRSRARFCTNCGRPVAQQVVQWPRSSVACPNCGYQNQSAARFCRTCGKPLWIKGATPTPGPVWTPAARKAAAPGECPNCGTVNPIDEAFCSSCGYALGVSAAAVPAGPAPTPAPVVVPSNPAPAATGPLPEQTRSGWILLSSGLLVLFVGIWASLNGIGLGLTGPLMLLGVFALIAARDLVDLFTSVRDSLPSWLGFVYGDANRGRRWGTIAAVLFIIVGSALAWLLFPLTLVVAMGFVLNDLLSRPLVESVGGRYNRPGGVTLLGWLLVASGIGAPAGIGLLIPKPWGRTAGLISLGLLGTVGLVGMIAGAQRLTEPATPGVWTLDLGGTLVQPLALGLLTLGAALTISSGAGIYYLRSYVFNSSQTAARRELDVVGWTLLFTGLAVILVSLGWATTVPFGGQVFWVGVLVGACMVLAARDLNDLAPNWRTDLPLLYGTTERGRQLGIAASLAVIILSALLIWQLFPLVLLLIALFVLRTLTGWQSVYLTHGKVSGPESVRIMSWLLIPTALGTAPGILMLRGNKWGWYLARPVLVLLALIGLGLAAWAGVGVTNASGPAWLVETTSFPYGAPVPFFALTFISAGGALAAAALVGLWHLHSAGVRQYFQV